MKEKKLSLQLTAIVLVASILAFTPPKSKNSIKVSKGELLISKVKFDFPWQVKTFQKALGKADRVDPGGNDIHTYDATGIILYEKSGSGRVTDFNIYFEKDPDENYNFLPKEFFKGSFEIEGFKVDKNTSLEKLKKALPDYKFVKSIIGAWRGEYKGLYIYVQYDKSESKIYWVSVGKKQ